MIKSINNIKAEALISNSKELLILDVRRFSEFKEEHIANAVNIPVDELEYELDELSAYKETPILVYCKVGIRSSIACTILEEAGFLELYNLRGGILDFNSPTVKKS